MVIKFKLRIFGSCQTKHSSTAPEHSSPAMTSSSPCTTLPPPSKQAPHRSYFKTHVSAFLLGPRSGNQSAAEDFKTHAVTKLFDIVSPRSKVSNSAIADGVVSDKKDRSNRKVEANKPKNVTISSARFSTSYTVNDVGKDEDQPEILGNPRKSFSDVGMRSRHAGTGGDQVSPEWGSPARLSVFKKLMPCKVEGKVKESFAVVKRSEKPYDDFKKSMMEMIVENQIYEESDLKELLQCYLSLNSWYHHDVIMEAFSEIWKTMFLDR